MKSEHFFINSLSPARQHHHQQSQHQPKATSFDFERTTADGTPFRSSNTNSLFGLPLASDNVRNCRFSGCSDKDSVCSAGGYSATRGKRLKSRNISMKSTKGVSKKSKTMDYTNYAYNEAVGRLKLMLADTYVAPKGTSSRSYLRDLKEDSTDNYSDNMSVIERPVFADISKYLSPSQKSRMGSYRSKKAPLTTQFSASKENLRLPSTTVYQAPTILPDFLTQKPVIMPLPPPNTSTGESVQAPVEIFNFIEKQEDYIEQLEKESKYCRNELTNLLGKVKEVINENEQLTENARAELSMDKLHTKQLVSTTSGSSDSDELLRYNANAASAKRQSQPSTPTRKKDKSAALTRFGSAPNIVYEARISELEAELMQANIDLKRLRTENDELKRKVANADPLALVAVGPMNCETHRKQIEHLQMEKHAMEETIRHLQKALDEAKSQQYTNSSKRYINDLMQMERSQAELEVKHLRDELDRQHERVRELQHEMSRRIAEERANAERRYNNQVDQLGGDLSSQWEQVAKLQLEIERQKRYESDLKRDLSGKTAQIDELKMELRSNRSTFLADMAQSNAEKQSLEQEITALRMQLDRAGRENKTEAARLNAEINSLRQRLDRADADLLHSKREVLRLNDEIANLEKELAYGELKNEIRPTKKDLDQRISEMQSKHAETVNELEDMIQNQKHQMDKLTSECKLLTNKLEDTTMKHNVDKQQLRETNTQLLTRLKQLWLNYKELKDRHDELSLAIADEIHDTAAKSAAKEAEEHLLDNTFIIEKPATTTNHRLTPTTRSKLAHHYTNNNNNQSPMTTPKQHRIVMSPYLAKQLEIWQMLSPQQQLQLLQQRQQGSTNKNTNQEQQQHQIPETSSTMAPDVTAIPMEPIATSMSQMTTNQATVTTLTMTKISKTKLGQVKSDNHHSYRNSTAQSVMQQAQQQQLADQHQSPAQNQQINTTMTLAKITPADYNHTIQTWPPAITIPTTAPTATTISSSTMPVPTMQAPIISNMPLAWSNMMQQVDRDMTVADSMATETMEQANMTQMPINMTQTQQQQSHQQLRHLQRMSKPNLNQQTLCPNVDYHHQSLQQEHQAQPRQSQRQQRVQRSHRHSHQRQPQQQRLTAEALHQQQQQRAAYNRERALALWGQQIQGEQSAAENPLCHNSLPRQPTKSSCDSTELATTFNNDMIDPFELEFSISSPSLMRSSSSASSSDRTCTELDDLEFESISQMSFSPPVTVIKRLETS